MDLVLVGRDLGLGLSHGVERGGGWWWWWWVGFGRSVVVEEMEEESIGGGKVKLFGGGEME